MRTKALTHTQYRKLCRILPTTTGLCLRLMYQTGLRVSDALSITTEHLRRTMTIREKKTGKIRKVKISKPLFDMFLKYVESTHISANEFILQIDRSTVYRHIQKQAEFEHWDNISAHSARKAYAKRYMKKYGIEATRIELQHDYITTTMLYVMDIDALTGKKETKGRRSGGNVKK